MPVRYEKFITREMVQNNPEVLFVFGDNMRRYGLGGQAKEMRGEPNAVGIPTKRAPANTDSAFFDDGDYYGQAKEEIANEFTKLAQHAEKGGTVVWPKDGIGTGLADLENRAPKLWRFIEKNRKFLESL